MKRETVVVGAVRVPVLIDVSLTKQDLDVSALREMIPQRYQPCIPSLGYNCVTNSKKQQGYVPGCSAGLAFIARWKSAMSP